MTSVLLIFHFLGLMLGFAGGFGGVVALAYARPAQKQKGGPIRGLGPVFTHISMAGLVLLWPTGIALVIVKHGASALTPMFWMKMGFVLLLTLATVSAEIVYARAKRGDPQAARLLPSLGPLSALSYVMAAIFSVLAFN